MRLKTNLATRQYLNTGAVKLALGGVCALLVFVLLYQVQDAAYRGGEIRRLKEAIAQNSRTTRGPQVSEAQYREVMGRVQAVNRMLAQRSADWVGVLDRVEEVVPPGIAITMLDPDRKTRQLKITGLARDFSQLRLLLENMEQAKHFSDVYLLTQTQTKVGLTQRGVSFSLTCKVSQL